MNRLVLLMMVMIAQVTFCTGLDAAFVRRVKVVGEAVPLNHDLPDIDVFVRREKQHSATVTDMSKAVAVEPSGFIKGVETLQVLAESNVDANKTYLANKIANAERSDHRESAKSELQFDRRLKVFGHYSGNIGFGIPTSLWAKYRFLRDAPKKNGFAHIIPLNTQGNSHQFLNQDDYYAEYSQAYYGITMKKGGWDSLRHYEIMLAGAVPYFLNVSRIPDHVMVRFPKQLISQAMHISGVPSEFSALEQFNSVRTNGMNLESSFDDKVYERIRQKILAYVEENLLTKTVAATVVPQSPLAKIRMHSSCPEAGYTQALLTIGLLEAGHQVCHPEYPASDLFDDYKGRAGYGNGFTYSRTLNRSEVNYNCDSDDGDVEQWDYYILVADCNRNYPRPYAEVVRNSKKVIAVNGNDAGRATSLRLAPVEAEELYVREEPSFDNPCMTVDPT